MTQYIHDHTELFIASIYLIHMILLQAQGWIILQAGGKGLVLRAVKSTAVNYVHHRADLQHNYVHR